MLQDPAFHLSQVMPTLMSCDVRRITSLQVFNSCIVGAINDQKTADGDYVSRLAGGPNGPQHLGLIDQHVVANLADGSTLNKQALDAKKAAADAKGVVLNVELVDRPRNDPQFQKGRKKKAPKKDGGQATPKKAEEAEAESRQ